MSEFDLNENVKNVVLALVVRTNVSLDTAEDLAASAFVLLWERNPEVTRHVAALLYTQSFNLFRDKWQKKKSDLEHAGKFAVHQLREMMCKDRRANAAAMESVMASIETTVTNISNTASAKNDVEKAFLDVLLTEPDVASAGRRMDKVCTRRWHLKIGLIIEALASRGFEVSRRDVENMRDRLQRNVDLRSVITLMRDHCGSRPYRPSRASR